MSEARAVRRLYTAAALVQAFAFVCFARPWLLFGRDPVCSIDYALHIYQVDRAMKAFRGWHQLWAWDPQSLAGQIPGVHEDLTSKGTELWVIALSSLGVSSGFAFNLVIALTHLSVPFIAYAAARLFRLDRVERAVATLLWVVLWWFDSFFHWAWWVGMISWALASCLIVLVVALLYRATEDHDRRCYAALIGVLPVLALVHPFAGLTLAVPCAVAYGRVARRLARWEHLLLALAALVALSTAAIWIRPALAFKHYLGDVDTFFRPTLSYFFYDAFDLTRDGINTGVPVRTWMRTACWIGAAVALHRWRKAGDARWAPLAALIVFGVLLAYVSGYLWTARQTQPYRNIGPAMLAAAIPAAIVLRRSFSPDTFRGLAPAARVAFVLLACAVVPRVVRDVVYYVPELLPARTPRALTDAFASSLVQLPGEPTPIPLRHEVAPEDWRQLAVHLDDKYASIGRVAVTDWVLAEYLTTATRTPILGGIPERPIPHVDAHPARYAGVPARSVAELEAYLERYAVAAVVVDGAFGPLDVMREALDPAGAIGGVRIYRPKRTPSYFAAGSGRVEQSLNLLRVSEAKGDEVVLRFHWLDTLRCRPGCTLERAETPGVRMGFLRVKNPPPEFDIFNSYELPRR